MGIDWFQFATTSEYPDYLRAQEGYGLDRWMALRRDTGRWVGAIVREGHIVGWNLLPER